MPCYIVFSLEQALCILANIADGNSAKAYIMGNEDILKKIMNYMVSVIFGSDFL